MCLSSLPVAGAAKISQKQTVCRYLGTDIYGRIPFRFAKSHKLGSEGRRLSAHQISPTLTADS